MLIRIFIVFLPLSLLLGATVWIFYDTEVKSIWEIIRADERLAVQLSIHDINAELSMISSDLLYLARQNALNDWFKNKDNITTKNIARDYYAFSKSKARYDQVRLLNDKGNEAVRVNWNNGQPAIVPLQELQDKSGRYYVRETLSLDQGQISMSPFDLNIEDGEIEQPIKPVIRFGTPIYDQQGQKRGLVILNYLGKRLIERIKSISSRASTTGQVWLINSEGYWLMGPKPEHEWGFMYPDQTKSRFDQEHAQVWRMIADGIEQGQLMVKNEGLYTYTSVTPRKLLGDMSLEDMPDQKPWHVVSFFPGALFASRVANLKHNLAYVYITLILISLAVAWITARHSAKSKQAELKMHSSETLFRELIEAAPDAIVIVDDDGRIVLVNAQTEELFKYSRDELLGRAVDLLVPERYRDQHAGHRHGYVTAPRLRPMGEGLALTGLCKDGTEFPVSISLSPMRTEQGVLVFCDIRDVTKQRKDEEKIRELNEALRKHNADLEVVNQELEAFSYSVSHDLRSPLRAIDGFSRILIHDYAAQLDETGRDRLQRVRNATQHLGNLIDDLLNLSRVTRAELKYSDVDMSALANEIITGLREDDPQRDARFNIKDGLKARGDPQLIRIALSNLIGNAWKFTATKPNAMIEFNEIKQNGVATYFVRDNGVGFDMAYVDKLFGAFQRLHDKREFPGTGIGLATVKRVINKHGGHIWAESAVNQGATFYFTLA